MKFVKNNCQKLLIVFTVAFIANFINIFNFFYPQADDICHYSNFLMQFGCHFFPTLSITSLILFAPISIFILPNGLENFGAGFALAGWIVSVGYFIIFFVIVFFLVFFVIPRFKNGWGRHKK